MKFLIILALLLVSLASYTSAQWQRCYGRVWMASCSPPGHSGYRGQGCPAPQTMWYYNRATRDCRAMLYMGCGGNSNRWCSRAACMQRCR